MGTEKTSSDTSIYVIDKNYKIRQYNSALKKVCPDVKVGEYCYKALCKEDKPCSNCPLQENQQDSAVVYNNYLKRWVEVSNGKIDWPEVGECRVLLSRQIQEGNKNLLYNLTNTTAYDELFEINLTANRYKILYHLEGKYGNLYNEGELDKVIQYIGETFIHPDDRESYYIFWQRDRMLELLEKQQYTHSLNGEFRKRITSGEYVWVNQRIVPVRQSADGQQIVMCFVEDITDQKKQVEEDKYLDYNNIDTLDSLTGLTKGDVFFDQAEAFLEQHKDQEYCLVAVDIEHFKLYNEWFGLKQGDRFLKNVAKALKKVVDTDGIAGYFGADDFCIILPNKEERLETLQSTLMEYIRQTNENTGFLPAYGVYEIKGRSLSVTRMYDRAVMAMDTVKGNYARRMSTYDTHMKEKMEEQHQILSEIQRAVKEKEIIFYLQPKCNMSTGKIIGLESLVRWNHPTKGVIGPGEFIPLLESNGFIPKLDQYVWEEVCIRLKRWIDSGRKPIPISVNVSRVDIYTLDVVAVFKELVKKYQIPKGLLEIEITETAYAEEYQIITKVVSELQKEGFTVLMDDFGSGYSSLNMLKDVNVDVLKMDMKFLDMNEHSTGKGTGILETIISMAKLMGIPIIAEGVETKEQVELLKDKGCLYGQGYYFYKPMPIEEAEEYLVDEENLDFRGMEVPTIDSLRIENFIDENIFGSTMMSNILGAIAFYQIKNGKVELLRVNDKYYKLTDTNPTDLEEERDHVLKNVYPEDMEKTMELFRSALVDKDNGASGELRYMCKDDTTRWIHAHVYFLKEQDGGQIFYATLADITEQRNAIQSKELVKENENLRARIKQIHRDVSQQKKDYLESKKSIRVLQKDALTGLYTRQAAIPKIKHYLDTKAPEEKAALIMFDLDNFKVANDVFGHTYGDSMITENAGKLQGLFRDQDIVCRIGGDEFLVLCKDINEEDVNRKLEKVIASMVTVYEKEGRKIKFTVSAGYAVLPEQGEEFDELYRKADIALFTAKMEGKSSYKKYDTQMKEIRYELAGKNTSNP